MSSSNHTRLGDCYVANGYEFLGWNCRSEHDHLHLIDGKIVHGEVTGQQHLAGVVFGHCWIEKDGTVYDFSNGKSIVMRAFVYYQIGKIETVVKYTADEYRKMIMKHETWGPWELNCEL